MLSNFDGAYVLNGFRCVERNIRLTLRMISEGEGKVSLWKMFDLTSAEPFHQKRFCLKLIHSTGPPSNS